MPVIRDSVVPLYQQIANRIGEMIKTGEIKPGEKLPTEEQLIEEYQVSKVTIRSAINLLVERGLVQTKQGKGVFAKAALDINTEISNFKGFYELLVEQGLDVRMKLVSHKLENPSEFIADKLNCSINDSLHKFQRLFYVNGQEFSFLETFFHPSVSIPEGLLRQLSDEPILKKIYDLLNLNLQRIEYSMSVQEPPTWVTALLKTELNQMLLKAQRTHKNQNNEIISLSNMYFNTDLCEVKLEIGKLD